MRDRSGLPRKLCRRFAVPLAIFAIQGSFDRVLVRSAAYQHIAGSPFLTVPDSYGAFERLDFGGSRARAAPSGLNRLVRPAMEVPGRSTDRMGTTSVELDVVVGACDLGAAAGVGSRRCSRVRTKVDLS